MLISSLPPSTPSTETSCKQEGQKRRNDKKRKTSFRVREVLPQQKEQ